MPVGDHERRAAVAARSFDDSVELGRDRRRPVPRPSAAPSRPRPCGSLDRSVEVHARHAGLRGERHQRGVGRLGRGDAVPLLGELDDRAALGRLVGQARRAAPPRRARRSVDAVHGEELGRLAVAERDRAGLVEQQRRARRRPPRPPGPTWPARCAARAGPCRRCRSPTAARRSSSGSGTRAARPAR